nr:hypothetical protein [Enterovibrio nigricans]
MSYRNANQGTGTEFQKPQAPNVEEGKPIGVVFGRVKITEGTVYWWGDLSYAEIKK